MFSRGVLCVFLLPATFAYGYSDPDLSRVPVRVAQALAAVDSGGQRVLDGVPAYSWRYGCGPTAAGMLFGYYDLRGFAHLLPGSAASQTAAVNEAIASTEHYNDYARPTDNTSTGIRPDGSNWGNTHADNSIADFMKTSRASIGNYYGWSWFDDVDDALISYTQFVNQTTGSSYTATAWNERWANFSWEKLVGEINSGRPMLLLVDTEGNNTSDHFVTAVGYREVDGLREYASFDTWSRNVRWEPFRQMNSGDTWGIFGATYFDIVPEPTMACLMLLSLGAVAVRRRHS